MRPTNKNYRNQIGLKKAKKRVQCFLSDEEKRNHPDWHERQIRYYRNTTKLCSCFMCRNPRKNGELTIQELKQAEKDCIPSLQKVYTPNSKRS